MQPLLTLVPRQSKWLFNFYFNRTDYTADRAGLLACGSLETSIKTLCKYAVGPGLVEEVNAKEFVRQLGVKGISTSVSEFFADTGYFNHRIVNLANFARTDVAQAFTRKDVSETLLRQAIPTEMLSGTIFSMGKKGSPPTIWGVRMDPARRKPTDPG